MLGVCLYLCLMDKESGTLMYIARIIVYVYVGKYCFVLKTIIICSVRVFIVSHAG